MSYEIAVLGIHLDPDTVTIETYPSMSDFYSTVEVTKLWGFGLKFRRDGKCVVPYVSKVSAGTSFINANCIKHYDHREFTPSKVNFIELSRVTKKVKTSGSCSAVGAGSQEWYWYALLPEMHPDASAVLLSVQKEEKERLEARELEIQKRVSLMNALDNAVTQLGYSRVLNLLTNAPLQIETHKDLV